MTMESTAKTHERDRKERQLWALLHQTSHAIERAREHEVRQFGISMMQSALMWVVKHIEPPATPARISRWLFREPNTVCALLDRMERRGLVRRVKNPQGGGTTAVLLTERGDELRRKSIEEMSVIGSIMSSLPDEEIDILITALQKVRTRALVELATIQKEPFT
jgi:DNA-binding MarR family transcriptional regulator